MKKIVLISGCSSGIGKSLAQKMASQGHTVFAGARKISDLNGIGDNIIPVKLDVNNEGDIKAVMSTIENQCGKLDILVNNAGYGAMGPLAEVPISQVQTQFSTNVFAPLAMSQQALPILRKSTKAIIVNIGSSAGIFTVPFSGVYGASKAAIHAMSEVLRMELAPFNVHVMTVYPGGVASKFGDTAAEKLKETLVSNSLYKPALPAIEKRARISSNSPTTPEMFSDELIKAMLKDKPPSDIRIGHGSVLMNVAKKVLPTKLREFLMRKAYQLNGLAS
ncbi:MAG: SDR family NAD(P)-dependent oxidoreductase [Bermanella sp.]